jgi:hypothetical protein
MAIDKKQLIEYVIKPVLVKFGLYSENALDLLLATCAQESNLGTYLVQQNGPALGIYQMEPATYNDIVNNVINTHPYFIRTMEEVFGKLLYTSKCNDLIWNLSYATIFCRLQYWRYQEPIPNKGDVGAMHKYWKTYYNRNPETGSIVQFVDNYKKYVGDY